MSFNHAHQRMEHEHELKLIFVYNADAGRVNAALDSAHKLLSPSTYACSLCAVTHHPLGMKKVWSRFIDSLDIDVEFLHRGQAAERFVDLKTDWPAVLRQNDGEVEVCLTPGDLAAARTLDELIELVNERLADESMAASER